MGFVNANFWENFADVNSDQFRDVQIQKGLCMYMYSCPIPAAELDLALRHRKHITV